MLSTKPLYPADQTTVNVRIRYSSKDFSSEDEVWTLFGDGKYQFAKEGVGPRKPWPRVCREVVFPKAFVHEAIPLAHDLQLGKAIHDFRVRLGSEGAHYDRHGPHPTSAVVRAAYSTCERT